MDQLNQTMENKIQEFEKSSKMLETNLIKKSNECDLYRYDYVCLSEDKYLLNDHPDLAVFSEKFLLIREVVLYP